MALPRYDEIHLPLLKLIHNNSVNRLKDAVEVLGQEFRLSDKALNERVPSGTRKFYSQVSFSKKRLIEADLIIPSDKPFKTTDTARELLATKPKGITNRDLTDLIKKRKVREAKREIESTCQVPLNIYDESLQKIKDINENDPHFFEYISGLILSNVLNVDFSKVKLTPPNNDGGVDGIIYLGESDETKVYFESKCKNNRPVPIGALRDFIGALVLRKAKQGYYFTTTRYTADVIRHVEKLKDPDININITLIDGHRLVELIFKYNLENEIISK
ncbi:restriction endonuclease [Bacillus cihuensis]|uniref:restriction endonuclease n=1 Tax=Bacillus cihuensis TaxID=1208599 RepID=UPI000427BD4D|nr:restriction endonuclease [Bacillus cihuensis]